MLRENMKKALKRRVMKVTFEKIDGSTREMLCTLNSQYLPETTEKTTKNVRKENNDVISVYDIENDGWRSFRIDNVVKFEESEL